MHKSGKRFLKENPLLAERISDCVNKLKEAFSPKEIILFGSIARGEYAPNKTMDLIIVAETELRFFERIKKALRACKGGKPLIEPLVYTPREIDLLRSQGEGFIEDAMEEGVVLFKQKGFENLTE